MLWIFLHIALFLSPPTAPEAADAPVDAPQATSGASAAFGPTDRFTSVRDACDVLTEEIAPEKWKEPIRDYCHFRSYHSTRHGSQKSRSRIDGTWIHDRDRPKGYGFYDTGVRSRWLNPEICLNHEIDPSIRHPKAERKFADNWPYRSFTDRWGKLNVSTKARWFKNSHDKERFGTRGPHDHSVWVGEKYLADDPHTPRKDRVPRCIDPEDFDRFDVSVTVTVRKSVYLCEMLDTDGERSTGCRNLWDIRRVWSWRGRQTYRENLKILKEEKRRKREERRARKKSQAG